MRKKLYGAIEGGGTKFVYAIVNEDGQILAESRCDTTSPEATLGSCSQFFEENVSLGQLTSLGIGCFGPLDPIPGSDSYGRILNTPKPGWSQVDVVGFFTDRLKLHIAFDTDVNGAVLAEQIWGAGKGLKNIVYYTVGTGIGGGVILDGKLVHGALHGELGHMLIPHNHAADPFEGSCPFHGDCLEGLASGTSMEKRWHTNARNLTPNHPAWELEAGYLAAALHNTVCMLSPERVILGGGVMSQTQLLPLVHQKLSHSLNGYMQLEPLKAGMENFVVRSPLEGKAGVLGAFALALSI
ncbi:MAG: ROK family protein [Anaerolineaceae bacterium]